MEIAKLIYNPSLKKPWIKYFNHRDINENIVNRSLYDNLLITSEANLNKIALIYRKRKISYKELFLLINKCINSFQALNITRKNSVLLALPEIPELIYSIYSLSKIGAIINYTQIDNLEKTITEINKNTSELLIILDETYNIIKDELTRKYKYIILVSINDSSLYRQNSKRTENTIAWEKFINFKVDKEIDYIYESKQTLLKYNNIIYNNEIFNICKYFFQKSHEIIDENIMLDYDINNFSIYISMFHILLSNNTIYLEPKQNNKKKLINNVDVLLTANIQNLKALKECYFIIDEKNYYYSQTNNKKIITNEIALIILFESKLNNIDYLPLINNDICIWNEKEKRECAINEKGNICINNRYFDHRYTKIHSDNKCWLHTNYIGCLKNDGSFALKNL